MKYKLYLSGPISDGGTFPKARQWYSVVRALGIARELMDEGVWVHVPHLTFLFDVAGCPRAYHDMLQDDKPMIEFCHGLLRLPGVSFGANREVEWAREMEKSIFTSLETFREFYKGWSTSNG